MCGVQLNDITRSKDLMLGLNKTLDRLAMVSVSIGVVMC